MTCPVLACAAVPLTRIGRRQQKSPSRCTSGLGPAQFSPLTTYGATDPRRSKMQTLVELPPTASPAGGFTQIHGILLHANPRHPASRKSTASCRDLLGNLRLLVQTRPSGPGAESRTGFSLSQSCFSCRNPARHKMCATAGKRRKKICEPKIPRSWESSISRSSCRSWCGCTLVGCVAPQSQDRQRHGEAAAPYALRGRSLGPDPH